MPAGRVVLLIALLIGLQPLSSDLYLPALPALTTGFGASMTQAQLTLTALVLALGVSQLFWGPVSDRFGRRPVLLVGMVAYALASVACAMAPSMDLLIFGVPCKAPPWAPVWSVAEPWCEICTSQPKVRG